MTDQPAARAAGQADAHRGLRAAALTAVVLGVLILAAAAFALSYPGIHAIALQTGVSASLARLYPLLFDAMLVVAGAAVLSLRGAGLVTRCYAWLTMLVLLAAVAGADALHATGTRIPHRPAAAAVAIVPWALVLISFGLLIAMLRYAQRRRGAGSGRGPHGRAAVLTAAPHGQETSSWPPDVRSPATAVTGRLAAQAGPPALTASPAEAQVPARAAAPAPAEPRSPGYDHPDGHRDPAGYDQPDGYGDDDLDGDDQQYRPDDGAELAVEADPGQDDPTSDEASVVGQAPAGPEAAMPPLDRMWSSPTPPDS
jgi:hypothetical protein